jgi:hypothetical protein
MRVVVIISRPTCTLYIVQVLGKLYAVYTNYAIWGETVVKIGLLPLTFWVECRFPTVLA